MFIIIITISLLCLYLVMCHLEGVLLLRLLGLGRGAIGGGGGGLLALCALALGFRLVLRTAARPSRARRRSSPCGNDTLQSPPDILRARDWRSDSGIGRRVASGHHAAMLEA